MYVVGDKKLSNQEAEDFALEFGSDVKTLAEQNGWEYIEEEGKTTVPGETTPPTGPEKKTAAGDSSLADTSLESQDPTLGKFIQVDGRVVYEDYYNKNLAGKKTGKGNYPATFEEYADTYNATIETESTFPTMLKEVEVIGKAPASVVEAKMKAERVDKEIANVNEFSEKVNIASEYFNLEQQEDGSFMPKVERPTYFPKLPGGRESGWAEFANDFETDLKNSLGERKYAQWKALSDVAGGVSPASGERKVTAQVIKDFYNDIGIDQQTAQSVVNKEKVKKAEILYRDYSEEEQDEIQRYRGDEELQQKKQEKFVSALQDERDYEQKTGRKLTSPQFVNGREYTPTTYVNYSDIIAEEQSALEKEFKAIDATNKSLGNQWSNIIKVNEGFKAQLLDIDDKLKQYKDISETSSLEAIAAYNQLIEQRNNIVDGEEFKVFENNWEKLATETEAFKNRINAAIEKSGTLADQKIGQDAALKSYEALDRLAIVWEEFTVGSFMAIAGTVGGLGQDLFSNPKLAAFNPILAYQFEQSKNAAVNYNKRLADKRANILPQNLTYEDLGKGASGFDYFGEMLINNSPSIVLALAPTSVAGFAGKGAARMRAVYNAGKLTSTVFGVAEAGGYLRDTELAVLDAEKSIENLQAALKTAEGTVNRNEILEQIKSQEELLNLSETQKAFNAAAYGTIASYAERLGTLGFLANFSKYSNKIGYDQFLRLGSERVANVASKTAGSLKGVGTGIIIEELEETATQVGQNLMDITVGQMDKSLIEGLDPEFFINVGVSSLAISGPSAGSNVYNSVVGEFRTSKEIKANAANVDELLGIQESLDSDSITAEQRKVLRGRKRELLTAMSLQDAESLMKVKQLSKSDVLEVVELQRKKRAIVKEANQIGSGAVDAATRKELEKLKADYNALDAAKEAILAKPEQQVNEATKEAVNPVEAAFNYSNYLFNLEVAKAIGKDIGVVYNEASIDNLNLSESEIAEVKRAYGTESEVGSNAIILNSGKIIIFEDNILQRINQQTGMEASIAAVSPLHEIGHLQTRAAGIIKDGLLVGNAENVVDGIVNEVSGMASIGRISKEQFANFTSRIDAYRNKNTGQVDVDELMQLVADFTNAGVLQKSSYGKLYEIKSFVNNVLKFVNRDSSMFFKINTAEDVFNFVSSWTTKVMEGRGIQLPPDELEETKESKALLDEINSLLPDNVTTQEEFFSRKVFNPIYNEGRLHPAISNYIRSRSVSKEEAQKIIESVADRLINFNPAAKRKAGDAKITLGEFIFSNVNFGKLDARKALFEEGQERAKLESTDAQEAKQLVAEVEAGVQSEKPTYRNLIQRRVLDEDVLNTAKSKVLSSIRVLKTRIDAPVSKNVTITPLVAEIKKALGKQIDIDLKKAMGGKKDGELRKFLLRNKAAILENMTTTWLMTAIPNAIQKQVDGVWTSDWKGKKIDREKVTTDNAGRTSGAELVRRLPKASTKISDAEFLANVLQEDGNPIRGRKESLAKAISEELAFDIIKEGLADIDSDIYKAFATNQERLGVEVTETLPIEFSRQAERGNVKFSNGMEAIQRVGLNIRTSFEMELPSNRGKGINKLLKVHNIADIYSLKTKEDIDAWAVATEKYVLPLLPKELFFSSIKPSGSSAFRRSSRFVGDKNLDQYFIDKINELRKLPESAFGSIPNLGAKISPSYETNIGKDDAAMAANIANGKVDAFNNYWTTVHAVMWNNINATIKSTRNNPDAVRAISTYLSFVSNDKTHPHKMGAAFVGYSKDAQGKTSTEGTFRRYEWEHAMPATNAYLYLMDAALNGYDFNAAYTAVMSNYKLIALDTAMDLKIKAAGLSNGMPAGWNLLENDWWERYTESNIDLNTIITMAGTTLAEAAGVDASGNRLSPRGTGFSKLINQEALTEAKAEVKNIENSKMSVALNDMQRKELNEEFNKILERKTGVEAFKTFSAVQAQKRGEKKGRFKFFIAPSVDDFRGLVNYAFAGKGKQGEADMKWLEDNLMTPYAKGVAAIDGIRQQIKRDFKSAVKAFPKQYQLLNKEIGKTGFTYDQAVRVYLWGKAGIKVPGLSQKDTKILQDAIRENPELMDFADAMLVVARRDTWMEPSEYWAGNTLLSDLNSMTEKIGRKKYLEEFIANADAIFTTENLNKIEALYGKAHRDAIEDSLYSMKNGTNRNAGGNKQVNAWLNWINGSTGAIMFFNRRSALLQMLSFTNFINWSDNNPVKAAAAFANQKQYWSDWAMIFNSNKLKERRGGLRQDVSSDEIASIANASKNSPQAILARLLQLGFTPTQIADSMAIATGGAMYYRNRVNALVKQGMSQKDAEAQAFIDFSKKSDEAQQSSDPALVSQLQRSNLGRLIFAFQNTPMQYTRLMKKAAVDLANNRGDWKENVSKIAYYGIIQNFIFSALQSALFAMLPGFDDDDEDLTAAELDKKNAKEEQKIARVLNSMLDTVLKGSGVYGAVFSTVKNIIREYDKQEKKGFMSNHAYTVLSLFDISPPIGSKARKVHSAIQTRKFEKDEIAARGWGVVADGRLDLGPNWSILGKVLSAAVSVPLDRVVDELTSISEAFDARNKAWQRIALALGWKTWDVGAIEENAEAIKEAAKAKRKAEGVEKAKETRAKNKKSTQFKDASDF